MKFLLAGDAIYSGKHLASFMKEAFAEDMLREAEKMERYAGIEKPDQLESSGASAAPHAVAVAGRAQAFHGDARGATASGPRDALVGQAAPAAPRSASHRRGARRDGWRRRQDADRRLLHRPQWRACLACSSTTAPRARTPTRSMTAPRAGRRTPSSTIPATRSMARCRARSPTASPPWPRRGRPARSPPSAARPRAAPSRRSSSAKESRRTTSARP